MKNWISLSVILLSFAISANAQKEIYQLSSHILDIGAGRPAANVTISLSKQDQNKNWVLLEEKVTDKNGRIGSFLKQDGKDNTGIYKLTFHTSPYFSARGRKVSIPLLKWYLSSLTKSIIMCPLRCRHLGIQPTGGTRNRKSRSQI